jgi:hypothetical protein
MNNWLVLAIFFFIGMTIFVFGVGYAMRLVRVIMGLVQTWPVAFVTMLLGSSLALSVGLLMMLYYGNQFFESIGR